MKIKYLLLVAFAVAASIPNGQESGSSSDRCTVETASAKKESST
jgi:hypothetical protein